MSVIALVVVLGSLWFTLGTSIEAWKANTTISKKYYVSKYAAGPLEHLYFFNNQSTTIPINDVIYITNITREPGSIDSEGGYLFHIHETCHDNKKSVLWISSNKFEKFTMFFNKIEQNEVENYCRKYNR